MPRRSLLLALCLCLIGAALWWANAETVGPSPLPVSRLMRQANRALADNDLPAVTSLTEQVLEQEPDHPQALLLAGEVAARTGDLERAIDFYSRVPQDGSESALLALIAMADLRRSAGHISQSEALFRDALQVDPALAVAHERLAYLARVTGRFELSRAHLHTLLDLGQWRPMHLAWLAAPERVLTSLDYLKHAQTEAPADPLPLLGIARLHMTKGHFAAAEPLLEQAIALHRQSVDDSTSDEFDEGWLAYGRCLWELDANDVLADWLNDAPATVLETSKGLSLLGLMAEGSGHPQEAVRAMAAAVRIDVNDQAVLHRLGTLLKQQGDDAVAAPLMARAQLLAEVIATADAIDPERPQQQAAREIATLMVRLDRLQEAEGWMRIAALSQDEQRAIAEAALPGRSTRQQIEAALAGIADDVPSPAQVRQWLEVRPLSPSVDETSARLAFTDDAGKLGVDFTYFESPDLSTEGRRMFEVTGGGVAAFDFDRDRWPDLYFTQGTEWPPQPDNHTHLDRLYRNIAGERFAEVTAVADITEPGFGQGIAAGDIDNDGFVDLHLANFGRNRLLINNGDGTFDERPLPAGNSAAVWTTSCAMADLNGDGWADLYDVNYVGGENVDTLICTTIAGARACTPKAFDAEPDRLCINRGDGTFEDAGDSSGVAGYPGKGMGIVVGNFDEDAEPEVFVGNDGMENYLLDQQPDDSPKQGNAVPRFVDVAVRFGVAFGAEGSPQACMGIAVADLDAEGGLDLFITNYSNESNALYTNESAGLFLDASAAGGVRSPSLPMLGFGTQAIDIEQDGDADLVVTNGDIDDFTYDDRPFRMRPQLFENQGRGVFREVPGEELGDYFSTLHRGRGLARLDWNRDHREDFVVSQLDESAAVVTNLSEPIGDWLSLEFVGRASARDAIGTAVRVQRDDRSWQHQLTAGDGYQATNERRLLIGLGPGSDPVTVDITWPGGATQTFGPLNVNTDYLLREGADRAMSLP